MSCLRGTQCCSDEVTSLYIPARRSADGWLRSKFFKTSSRDKVTTYITWVNNQLSKHGTGHQISSLEKGLSDGVTLPQLLHVLADEPVPGVTIPPYTEAMRKGNIRLCFQYLQHRHIHPRNSTAPDVSNGNLKCIMRLLLALAANFKTYRADANKSRSLADYSSSNGQSNVRSLINSQEQKSKEQNQPVQQESLEPVIMFEKEGQTSCLSIANCLYNLFYPRKADEEEIHWMYDQVVDTRKQIESLKHLLLKEAEGEQLPICQCNELSERLTTTEDMVETVTDKLNSAQQAIVERDETIMALRAQLLRMKMTNDHSPTYNDKTISDLQVKLSVKEETLKRLVDKNEDFPESKNCSEELLAARQCLDALRLSLAVDSPGQHRLDHLEQILNVTVQRNKRENRNNRRPVNTLTSDGSTCSSQGDYNMNMSPFANRRNKSNNQDNTKILYYMDNSTTPYLSQIQKKLGQITLSDFKEVFDRSGHYRYHFKSVDTEFGPVKEELVGDDTVIPGWEGRIVGWVEELSSSLDHVEI